ncbi:MAG: DUF2232 domain-containing protein [Paenibacillaceae bacterium]
MTPSIKQSLLWCVVLIIELLSLFTPANFLTITLIMVPMLMLYLKLDLKKFSLAYVSSLFVLFVLLGGGGLGFLLIMYSLFFVPPTVAMGQLYKRAASVKTVLVVAILVLIAEVLVFLLMGQLTGVNPVGNLKIILTDNLAMLPEQYRELVGTDYVEKITWMLPFLLLVFAAFYVMLTHAITRRLLKKSTNPLPGLPPMREWRLPKSLVWYFLVVFVIGLFITKQSDLYFLMIVYNLLPLFMVLFVTQAVGLLYAFVYFKRWSRFIPIVLIVLSMLPPILYLVCLLGILDILMPLRQRFFK